MATALEEEGALWVRADGGAEEPCLAWSVFTGESGWNVLHEDSGHPRR
ncbi:MAG: hypothetical protein KA230_06785 [Flavobacteriales bacterium]|nr:hypothetical protein [Flavobacteriales bacterium]